MVSPGRKSYAGDLGVDLCVGTGGLDHHHIGGDAFVALGHLDVLGTCAVDDFLSFCGARGTGDGQTVATGQLDLPTPDATGQEIHGGRSDKARHKLIGRSVVQLKGGADLLDHAVAHDHDFVGHGHGLDLIVGHVDRGGANPLVQLLDLGAHLHTQFRIQVGQGLVKQKDL
jgi:hypothetical protein